MACLKGRLEVWQVIFIAQGYADNAGKIAQHLNLTTEQVQAALDYAVAYPEEIQQALQENADGYERLARMLPQIQNLTSAEDDREELDVPQSKSSCLYEQYVFLITVGVAA